jgi:hypothetical protein
MRVLLKRVQRHEPFAPPAQLPFTAVPMIQHWVVSNRAMPQAQQAAALYVADVLLQRVAVDHTDASAVATLRDTLSSFGVGLDSAELEGDYRPDHSLMQKAFKVASTSPVGQQAFLFLLNSGFRLHCCCRDGGAEEVIRQGTQFLRRYPTAQIRQEVLLGIADAYRDIDSFTNYIPEPERQYCCPGIYNYSGHSHPPATRRQAGAFRRRAMRFYREAYRLDPLTSVGRKALAAAWELSVGLFTHPDNLRFDCTYD